jgi:hypothetical protein
VSTNPDSFIDEVAAEVRRERLNTWLRRWGWLVGLGILGVVGGAGWLEWRQSQAEATAELRGEAILSALEIPDAAARLAALAELPREGPPGVVAALLLAAEQQAAGEAEAAAATLAAVAADATVAPLYRDLAALKRLMILGPAAPEDELVALAAPGAPFRQLALEQIALGRLARGEDAAALEGLLVLLEDAATGPAQRQRVEALAVALGWSPETPAAPGPAPAADPAATPAPAPTPDPADG